jgi:hypothetical protein
MTETAGGFDTSLRILAEAIRGQGTTVEKLSEALWRVYESINSLKTDDKELLHLLGITKDKIDAVQRDLALNTAGHDSLAEKIERVRTDVLGRLVEIHTFIARYEQDIGPDGIKEALRDILIETEDGRKELFRAAVRDVLGEAGTGLVLQQRMRDALKAHEQAADDEAAEEAARNPKGMLPFFKILVIGVVISFLALVWAIVLRDKDGGSFQVDKGGVKIEAGSAKPQEPK